MRTIDLSPLYRSLVGVDRMMDLIDAATRADSNAAGYPPFNVEELGEDAFRIELAVAGFTEAELDVEVHHDTLTVTGRKDGEDARSFLHRGIAQRAFERRFKLADHVKVTGAGLNNGLLSIELAREVPETEKPRRIAIASRDGAATIIDAAE